MTHDHADYGPTFEERVKVRGPSSAWDLSSLQHVIMAHFMKCGFVSDRSVSQVKDELARLLQQIKRLRNLRAHDNPVVAEDAFELARLSLKFFEVAGYKDLAESTFRPRVEEAHLLCLVEAAEKRPEMRVKVLKMLGAKQEEEVLTGLPAKRVRRA